jgi:hypothetical protein
MFSFFESLHIVFQSGCTSLHSHQQCMRVPFSLHPHQYLLLMVFLMITILTGVRFLAIWTSLIKFCLVQLLLLYWLIDFGGVQFLDFHVFSSLTNIIPQFVLSSALQLDNSLPSYPLLSSICLRHWALNGLSTSYIGPNTLVRCREPMLPQTTTNQTVSES